MSLRAWVLAAIVIWAAYGCAMILAAHYGVHFGPRDGFMAWAYYYVAPWVLLIAGFTAWRHTRGWRRMLIARANAQSLSRGAHSVAQRANRPSALEKSSLWLVVLAIVTLFYKAWWLEPHVLLSIALMALIFTKMVRGLARAS